FPLHLLSQSPHLLVVSRLTMVPVTPRRRPRLSRHLPDLCLVALFKQISPNDQLTASGMSTRAAILVRAANRRVKMLVITSSDDFEITRAEISRFTIASNPSVQLLPAVGGGEPFSDYPVAVASRFSKWNHLVV